MSTFVSPINGYELVETFEYYDGPKLFSCKDRLGQLYLAVWAEELDDADRWLLVPMTSNRLRYVRSGKMGLRDAFVCSESEHVFEVLTYYDNEPQATCLLQASEIPDEDLPGCAAKLHFSDVGELIALESTISERAYQFHREVLDFALGGALSQAHEIAANLLGAALLRLQNLAYALAIPNLRSRGRMPLGARETYLLKAVAAYPSSFGLRLEANVQSDILGESPMTRPLKLLMDLLEAGDDRERLREMFAVVGPTGLARYRLLLKTIKQGEATVGASWASPTGGHRKARLTFQQLSRVLSIFDEEGELTQNTLPVAGDLVAIDTERDSFKLRSDDRQLYYGSIAKSLSGNQYKVPARVKAELLESFELHPDTGEERVSYELVSLELTNSQVQLNEGSPT